MDTNPSSPEAPEKKPVETHFDTYLRDTALALSIATAIMYFWGYQYNAGFLRHFLVSTSLVSAQPLDYIYAAWLPLFVWLVVIGMLLLIKGALKDLLGPKRWARVFPVPSNVPAELKKGFWVISSVMLILLTGAWMDDQGEAKARSHSDSKRVIVFHPEPEVAKGKQLYFLTHSNGTYLSYFHADESDLPSVIVVRDESVDFVVFPGQKKTDTARKE